MMLRVPAPSRRGLLGAALALTATPRAFALGESSQLDVAEIVLAGATLSRPNAWIRLLYELIQTTSVEASPRAVQVAPDDPELFAHPFAVLVGNAALPTISQKAREQLVRYVSYGGFLLIDNTTGEMGGAFDRSARDLVASLFPTRPLAALSADHSIYRSFFLLREPVGRLATHRVLEGVQLGSMHPVIYCPDDLSGALDRRPDGFDIQACTPGGELQRREAIKLAINLVMYALTSNYKHDQAHVRALMEEGRLE
jgi:hypothetical protein